MMTALMPYYRSKVLVGIGVGLLGGYLSGDWPTGVLATTVFIAGAIWAPRSGHFVVDPSRGAAALREDERSRAIRARAAEVGFQVMLVAGCLLWFVVRSTGRDALPHAWLVALILLGVATQISSQQYFHSCSPTDQE